MHQQHWHPSGTMHKSVYASNCSYMSLQPAYLHSPGTLQDCLTKMEEIRNHLFGCIKLTSLSCSKILCSNQCLNYRLADWAQELGIFIELSFNFIAYISPHTMETIVQFHALYHYT
uniref:Uncharacterized protein n=1 Tax=Oryza meridionalis TaxID=40149 RepID=A0A0E0D3D4_9ORYZ